jgi:hypothetical protein
MQVSTRILAAADSMTSEWNDIGTEPSALR